MSRNAKKINNRAVDMSLPPELRHRQRQQSGGPKKQRPIAQMDHASSGRARKRATEGEDKMARAWSARTAHDRHWARFGDAYHELPRWCWLAEPQLVREPRYGAWPGTQYEGLVVDLLGRGVPVPDHPSACAVPGCGHARVWHQHKTRDHRCEVHGCACTKLMRQPANRTTAA